MGKISAIAKLFGEAAKAEELGKTISLGAREGAMSAEEVGSLAKKSGVTPQQVVRAEKVAGSARFAPNPNRALGYEITREAERDARISPSFRARYFDFPEGFTTISRREIQPSLEAAKKAEPKSYQAMKDWTSAPAGTPAPEEPLRKITSSIMGEEYHPSWKTGVRDMFTAAARRGTLPAAAAAAGGAYAAQGWGDTARDLYTGPDNSHRTPTVQWGRNRQ